MANSFKLLTLLFITALIISSCSSENECDNACQRDQVQLLDCSCVADANSIIVIKGQAGTGANASSLLVARGGKINALGTADAPIIMTSIADQIQPGQVVSPNLAPDVTGLWGGLIILGNAPISASAEAVQIEGIPTSDSNGLYGGTDAMDNSGTIQYVSVRHGGTNIGEGNEINGITFGGVGAGTVVENVEVLD